MGRVEGPRELVCLERLRSLTEKVSAHSQSQLTADKEALALAASLGIAFAKHLGSLFLPPIPQTTADTADAAVADSHDFPALASDVEEATDATLVPREMKDKFRKLLVAYLEALGRREAKLHLARACGLALCSSR